jgi:spore coat protein A
MPFGTRRAFLKFVAAQKAAMRGLSFSPASLERWVDPLPIPEVLPKASRYRIVAREFQAKAHRDLPATTFWGYNGQSPGPTIETRSGEAFTVEWVNALPTRHLFAVDHAVHGAEADKPDVRTVVHVHGAKAPPESDGNPERWIVPGHSEVNRYPNRQEAAALFYHDHAMGITRLNTAAGLFGMLFVRDAFEDLLGLPRGAYEIPIAIYDRLFRGDGQLDYPAVWTSEFYGNAILLNGKLFPFLDVEARRYRFRIVNVSNAGFYTLSFSKDGGSLVPGVEPFHAVGSDQGLLSAPVEMKSLAMTPGERADLVFDFSGYAGREVYLKHGPAPVMKIRVAAARVRDDSRVPAKLRPIRRIDAGEAVRVRELTLDHRMDSRGQATLMLLNNAHYSMPVTERPALDSVEVWTLVNLTDDTHPIHLHLVRFQILERRRFDFEAYRKTGKLVFTGPAVPPEPHEAGWKDTVRADVLMATRIVVRFEGYRGRYVWHCHVLEHEDNEMMRPFEVV